MSNAVEIVIKTKDDTGAGLVTAEAKLADFKTKAKRQIDEINAKKLQIDADTVRAEQKLERLKRARDNATEDRRIQIDADIAAGEAKLALMKRKAEDLAFKAYRLQVDADTATAEVKVAGVKHELDRVDGKTARAKVNVDVAGALGNIAMVMGALAGIGGATMLGGAALGLGAVGGAIFGGSLAVGMGGLSGIGGAITALGQPKTGGGGGGGGGTDQGRQIERANQNVARSEQELKNAQLDSKRAQDDLTRARGDAARQLADLQTQTEDMALSQRQSSLDVEQAQVDLNKTLADPTATDLQRRQAQLAYEEAVQRQKDLGQQAQQLAQDKAQADAKGIEGSDQVVAAQDKVRQAQQQVGQATIALKNAQEDALAATKKMGGGGAAAIDPLKKAMDALTPAGRNFAVFMRGFIDGPLKDLRNAAQNGFLPGLQRGFEAMVPIMPGISRSVGDLATTLGNMAARTLPALAGLAKPFLDLANSGLQGFLTTAGPALGAFATAMGDVMSGMVKDGSAKQIGTDIGNILAALLPLVPALIHFGADMAVAFGPHIADLLRVVAGFLTDHVLPALDQFGRWISDNKTALEVFAGLIAVLALAWAGVSAPVLGVIAAVIAVAAVAKLAWDRFEPLREMFKKLGEIIMPALGVAFDAVKDAINRAKESGVPWGELLKLLVLALGAVAAVITVNVVGSIVALGLLIDGASLLVKPLWVAFKDAVKFILIYLGDLLDGAVFAFGWIPGIGDKLKGAQQAFRDFATGVNNALDGIQDRQVHVTGVLTLGNGTTVTSRSNDTVSYKNAKGPTVNAKATGGIIGAASGGARSAWTMVGEHGRELVRLPYGSQVYSSPDTERMTSGGGNGGGNNTLTLEVVGNDAGLVDLFRKMVRVRGGNVQAVFGT